MDRVVERFAELDLKLFSAGDTHVLFNPDTLKVFLLSDASARIVRDLCSGDDLAALSSRHGFNSEELHIFIEKLIQEGEKPSSEKDTATASEERPPKLPKLVLMVNNYCNLKCTYCYEHATVFKKKAIDMPKAILHSALEKFFAAFQSIGQIMFIGGEPTLSEEIVEEACNCAVQLAKTHGMDVPTFAMISNGARMTERMYELIRQHGIQVTFSIDGPPAVHDLVRIRHDGKGSYDEVAANIKRYSKLFPEKLGIECTVTRAHQQAGLTIADLSNFFAAEFRFNAPHIAVAGLADGDPLNPYEGSDHSLRAEFEVAAEKAMRNIFDAMCTPADQRPELLPGLDLVSGMFKTLIRRQPAVDMCPAGISQLVVDAFGDMYPCWMFAGMDQFKMGNILHADIFNELGLKVRQRIQRNTKAANPQCSVCYARNVCHSCLGNNQNATGAIEQADERFCNGVRTTLRTVLVQIGEAKQDKYRWAQIRSAALQANHSRAASSLC